MKQGLSVSLKYFKFPSFSNSPLLRKIVFSFEKTFLKMFLKLSP